MLHIYLLATRFRCLAPATAAPWQQHLLDHFFFDAERRMEEYHRMNSRMSRARYLKDLFLQYRGAMAAYDEGLCKGDAVLATALWRNVFAADEEVDLRGLAAVVGHVRRTVRGLEMIDDAVLVSGSVRFADPSKEEAVVSVRSSWMDKPFVDEVAGQKVTKGS